MAVNQNQNNRKVAPERLISRHKYVFLERESDTGPCLTAHVSAKKDLSINVIFELESQLTVEENDRVIMMTGYEAEWCDQRMGVSHSISYSGLKGGLPNGLKVRSFSTRSSNSATLRWVTKKYGEVTFFVAHLTGRGKSDVRLDTFFDGCAVGTRRVTPRDQARGAEKQKIRDCPESNSCAVSEGICSSLQPEMTSGTTLSASLVPITVSNEEEKEEEEKRNEVKDVPDVPFSEPVSSKRGRPRRKKKKDVAIVPDPEAESVDKRVDIDQVSRETESKTKKEKSELKPFSARSQVVDVSGCVTADDFTSALSNAASEGLKVPLGTHGCKMESNDVTVTLRGVRFLTFTDSKQLNAYVAGEATQIVEDDGKKAVKLSSFSLRDLSAGTFAAIAYLEGGMIKIVILEDKGTVLKLSRLALDSMSRGIPDSSDSRVDSARTVQREVGSGVDGREGDRHDDLPT